DSHHMPAKSLSPLHPNVSPAIQMAPEDHQLTASYGGRIKSSSYAGQKSLIAQGRVMDAIALDALDVKQIAIAAGDPAKYDSAMAQMMLYAKCLQSHGIIR
uniref:hypothetical protein n=1 Tax=Rhizobium sp. FKY42 TaxID=2562310 RepID=UPI0019820224